MLRNENNLHLHYLHQHHQPVSCQDAHIASTRALEPQCLASYSLKTYITYSSTITCLGVLWSDSRAATRHCVLVKVLQALYVSTGTMLHSPGIYNTSLPSHHKTLLFINVNACDLYSNVSSMSQLKGALMSATDGGGTSVTTGTDRDVTFGVKERFPMVAAFLPVALFLILPRLIVLCGIPVFN